MAATALEFLREAGNPAAYSAGRTRIVVAYGVVWAEESCRIDGTLAIALQRASADAGEVLLNTLLDAGVNTAGDVPRWLLRNREAVLRILAPPQG
jgi:hypothetical protein